MNDSAQAGDEHLMLAWVAGEIGAFEQLYARHRSRLYRYLLRHVRDGAITGVGRETVKSRLRYAMDKLRARLGPAR